MREEAFKDTRLLDALEYIDDSYISSAARYKMKYEDKPDPILTWKTPLKHWKAFAALAACLLLLAFASPIVNYVVEAVRSFAAGWGSEVTEAPESTDESVYNDVILELCKSCVDYSVLTPELIDEINSAWKESRNVSDVLITSIEDLKYGVTKPSFLGEYNGYTVFAIHTPILTSSQPYGCANHTFTMTSSKLELVAYKNGTVSDLAQVYNAGKLDYLAISEIHDRLMESMYYCTLSDQVGIVGKVIECPEVPILVLEENIESQIKETVAEKLVSESIDKTEIFVTDYYGSYNGAYVFRFKSPAIKYNDQAPYCETIGNVRITYFGDNRIYVYAEGDIFSLTEAYEKGLLDENNISEISKYHSAYYPFILDEYYEHINSTGGVQPLTKHYFRE